MLSPTDLPAESVEAALQCLPDDSDDTEAEAILTAAINASPLLVLLPEPSAEPAGVRTMEEVYMGAQGRYIRLPEGDLVERVANQLDELAPLRGGWKVYIPEARAALTALGIPEQGDDS